jgi:hypothetical protein
MPKQRLENLGDITSLRVTRKTANVVGMIAKAKNLSANELLWIMLERQYPEQIRMAEQLYGEQKGEEEGS